jgi:hypothetical protein
MGFFIAFKCIFIIMIKEIIKEQLLLEKRIHQMTQNIEVTIAMDLIKPSGHVTDRSLGYGREEIEGYEMREVSNQELRYFVDLFKKDIAEKIVTGEIKNEVPFVIKSPSKQLAIPIIPVQKDTNYWNLIIKTIWRESKTNPIKTFRDQLVIEKP